MTEAAMDVQDLSRQQMQSEPQAGTMVLYDLLLAPARAKGARARGMARFSRALAMLFAVAAYVRLRSWLAVSHLVNIFRKLRSLFLSRAIKTCKPLLPMQYTHCLRTVALPWLLMLLQHLFVLHNPGSCSAVQTIPDAWQRAA